MKTDKKDMKPNWSINSAAIRVSIIYAVFSLMWILFSDQILFFFIKDASFLTKIQIIKGWAFVIVTTLFVYILLVREMKVAQDTKDILHEGEKSYRDIFNSTTEAIFINDYQTGKIIDFNKPMQDMFGYTRDEILNLSLNDLSYEKSSYSQKESMEYIKRVTAKGTRVFEWKAMRKNGEGFWTGVSLKSSIIGEKNRFIAVVRDITNRKNAEKAMVRKNRALKIMGEITKATINAVSRDKLLNECCNILAEEGGYKTVCICLLKEGKMEPVAKHGNSNNMFCSINPENNIKNPNHISTEKPVIINDLSDSVKNFIFTEGLNEGSLISIPMAEDERFIGVTRIHSDQKNAFDDDEVSLLKEITSEILFGIRTIKTVEENRKMEEDKKKIEKQLVQNQKMEAIGSLAGGIAHDFNNILTIILGYSEVALRSTDTDSDQAKNLETIIQAVHRAKDLVEQILVFSRQAQVEIVTLKPQSVIREALKMLRSSIPSTIDIEENLSHDCGLIDADPTQLHQIMMNLGTNAYHAMERKGGILSVTLKKTDNVPSELKNEPYGNFVLLRVKDTGSGIPEEFINNIFDPFFTTKEKGKGTGMGLSITYGIVRKYGGFIYVDSTPGEGTCIDIYFPVSAESDLEETSQSNEIPTGSERILMVDDEEMIVNITKDMLENLGYTVTAIDNSLKGLEIFTKSPDSFDLVITDQTMPGMTGIELSEKILEMREGIPIILCTGYSNLVDEKTAKERGIKKFVLKPITLEVIAQSVREVLDQQESIQ